MPWTLWRYTLVELWRLVLLSTGVLVGVIAFAAAVKPLADGELTPIAAIRFMLLAVPPMLAYALPFAASFGATLAYYRMAQDNEVVAALAGGVSHRALLLPALVSGAVLALALAGLNEQVIPRFLSAMERMVTRDLAQVLVRQIGRGQPVTIDNLELYADGVRRLRPRPGSGLVDVLELSGVAVVELDQRGGVASYATAERARIELEPGPARGFEDSSFACLISFGNGVGSAKGRQYSAEWFALGAFPVPDAFEDDPKFLTRGELYGLRDNPEAMGFVESRRRRLVRRMAATESVMSIQRAFDDGAPAVLSGPDGLSVSVRGGSLVPVRGGWEIGPAAGARAVAVERIRPLPDGERDIDLIDAEAVVLRVEESAGLGAALSGDTDGAQTTFRLEMTNVSIRTPDAEADGLDAIDRPALEQPGLALRQDPTLAYIGLASAPLIDQARTLATVAPANEAELLLQSAGDLEQRIARLMREITSKSHERLAMAVNCLVMVVTGAVTALRLRNSLPLVVYLWSFFPALLTVLLIAAGQQHAHGESLAVGLPMLWAGVLVLGGYAAAMLASLSRH